MANQVSSPFVVPPPKPSETEKIQKDYYESTMKVKDSSLQMNETMIIDKDKIIFDLEDKVINLVNNLRKLEKENKELNKKVEKYKKKSEDIHDECDREYGELEADVNSYADENEALKEELFKCKFKEKHIEGSRNLNKKSNYDDKCVKIGIENVRLKQDIEMLASCNRERYNQINDLQEEIHKLKGKVEDFRKAGKKPILRENEKLHNCDFCELVFTNKSLFKLHLVKDHEIIANSRINMQRLTLMQNIQKLKMTEQTQEKEHYCKGFCLIDHSRFKYIRSKAEVFSSNLLELNNNFVKYHVPRNKDDHVNETFNKPSL